MAARPKFNLYLVHQETGQRYPVGEEVIIGRSSGDILFGDDVKLSSQHCRIYRTPKGLGIHDLNSQNGTYIDGIPLNPKKVYGFKPGSALTLGHQIFKLEETNLKRPTPRKRHQKKSKKKTSAWDPMSLFSGLVVIAAFVFLTDLAMNPKDKKSTVRPTLLQSPFAMVEKEMNSAFAEYSEIGKAHSSGKLTGKDLSTGLRKDLIPKLIAVHEKFAVLKAQSEFEKRKIAVNRKLVFTLIDQMAAMATYAENNTPQMAEEVERLSAVAAAASEEARKLETSRTPSNYDY